MTPAALKQLESDFWSAADNLRANSDLKSSEYSTPVLGLIFLKFADNKYRQYENKMLAEYTKLKDAKAKLWDSAQVQEYLHAREFNLSPNLNRFELLIHRVRDDDPQYSDRQILQVQEAVYELEAEADKKEIHCRPLRSADEIAGIIVKAEAT